MTPDRANDATGLRSPLVTILCATFSLVYVVVVLGCSTFCLDRGSACGGDGQIYYVPFFLFPFCLMSTTILMLTLCSRLRSLTQIRIALAAFVVLICPSLLAPLVHHDIYRTTIVFLLPVTACLLGGAAYLAVALARGHDSSLHS